MFVMFLLIDLGGSYSVLMVKAPQCYGIASTQTEMRVEGMSDLEKLRLNISALKSVSRRYYYMCLIVALHRSISMSMVIKRLIYTTVPPHKGECYVTRLQKQLFIEFSSESGKSFYRG